MTINLRIAAISDKDTQELDKFFEWIAEAKYYLPGKMTLHEAKELYNRKVRDDEERYSNRSTRTESTGAMDELPPNCT